MVFDVSDASYKIRLECTSEALLLNNLDKEDAYRVERGYSEQQGVDTIRSAALFYCYEFITSRADRFVGYIALTYVDRFLSRNNNIPVVIPDEGFERNLQLFALCCVSIAYREALLYPNFNRDEFVERYQQGADLRKVEKMESLIREGLEGRVEKITAFTFAVSLLPLLEMEDEERDWVFYNVFETLIAISQDIKFTEFRFSTLGAAVILIACYKLYPDLHHGFFDKILKSRFVKKKEVVGCFNELKDNGLVENILNTLKNPIVATENVVRTEGKGKEPLIEDGPYLYEHDYEEYEDEEERRFIQQMFGYEEDERTSAVTREEEHVDTSEISENQQEPDEEEEETRFIQQMFGFQIC